MPNPAVDMEPRGTTDAVLGDLERPKYIPSDMDRRVDRASVWMKTVPGSGEVVYFIPGSCTECLRLQQHCDRSKPVCGRCQKRGAECRPGGLKVLRPTAPIPIEWDCQTGSGASLDKSKARQMPNGDAESDEEVVEDESGRGKRVKKKRRLSASDEVDPNLLNFDGSGLRKARSRPSRPVTQLPPSSSTGYLRPEDVTPTDEDRAYDEVCSGNTSQELEDPRGIPPFWADRRRAVQAALPYFRDPVATDGAKVDIGPSGIARGVILDGIPRESVGASFFGMGERAGTIVTNM